MKIFTLFILLFFNYKVVAQQLKPENTGCPENSHCSKELGIKRDFWLKEIKKINTGSEVDINANILKISQFPINVWANEDQKIGELPMLFWNSPCKQHNPPNPKILIGEIFVPNLKTTTIKKYDNIIFNKIFYLEEKKWKYSYVPRGDAPIMTLNNKFYYIREEEGNYFGLLVAKTGDLTVVKTKKVTNFPKEIECTKEMIEEFYKEAPTLSFFKGQLCKEIWNQDKKSYEPIMLGWSCN